MFARRAGRHVTLHFGGALGVVLVACLLPAVVIRLVGTVWPFALLLPALAVACLAGGMVWKVGRWMRAPVPFRIPLTAGQQRTFPSIPHSRLGCPHTAFEVMLRVLLDVILFRPLLRATPTASRLGSKLSGIAGRWLWLLAAAFHGSLLVIALRHLRLFLTPVPSFVAFLEQFDSATELAVPKVHVTGLLLLLALGLLLGRRLVLVRLRYISLAADYFPLLLLGAIAITGLLMRHVTRTDVAALKLFTTSIPTLTLVWPAQVDLLLWTHVFLVCVLLGYFPLSKLMHMPGALMSPTLTQANDNREVRHVNVRNPKVEVLSYAEYESAFRERMIEAGLPVEDA
jgi:nitrate reductase gamma subunit